MWLCMGDGMELWILFLYTIVENMKGCIVKSDALKIRDLPNVTLYC